MAGKNTVIGHAKCLGLGCVTSGHGNTKYKFFIDEAQPRKIGEGLGSKQALAWLEGFETGVLSVGKGKLSN